MTRETEQQGEKCMYFEGFFDEKKILKIQTGKICHKNIYDKILI